MSPPAPPIPRKDPFTFSITASPQAWESLPSLLSLFPREWPLEPIDASAATKEQYPLLAPQEGLETVVAVARNVMGEFTNGDEIETGTASKHLLTTHADGDFLHPLLSIPPNRRADPARPGRMVVALQQRRAVVMAFMMQSLGIDYFLAEAMLNDIVDGSPATTADISPACPEREIERAAGATEADVSILLLDDLGTLPSHADEVNFAFALAQQALAGRYAYTVIVTPEDSLLDSLESVRKAFMAYAPTALPFRPLLGSAAVLAVAGLSCSGKSALCAATAKRAGSKGIVLSMGYVAELAAARLGVELSGITDEAQKAVEIVRQLDIFLKWHPGIKVLALDCLGTEIGARHLMRLIGNGDNKANYCHKDVIVHDDDPRWSINSKLLVVYLNTPDQQRRDRAQAGGEQFSFAKDYAAMAAGTNSILEFADCVVKNNGSLEDTCKQVWGLLERVGSAERVVSP